MADTCPISVSEPKLLHGIGHALKQTAIPAAVDLASLINTVNSIREALRSLTSSRTVNNISISNRVSIRSRTTIGAPDSTDKKGDTIYTTPYPEWRQSNLETHWGYVFHKDKKQPDGFDHTQKVKVMRLDTVEYENDNAPKDEKPFRWHYYKKLDQLGF